MALGSISLPCGVSTVAIQFGKELVEHCFNWTMEHIRSQNPFPAPHLGALPKQISCSNVAGRAATLASTLPYSRCLELCFLSLTTPCTPSEKSKLESGQSASLPPCLMMSITAPRKRLFHVFLGFLHFMKLSWTSGGSALAERNHNKQKCL